MSGCTGSLFRSHVFRGPITNDTRCECGETTYGEYVGQPVSPPDHTEAALNLLWGIDYDEESRVDRAVRHLESARAEREALLAVAQAAQALLADDDMPNHWDDCVCSYCTRNRALRAALARLNQDTT